MVNEGNFEKIDRISELPDEVLCHILSFLPSKEAIAHPHCPLDGDHSGLWFRFLILSASEEKVMEVIEDGAKLKLTNLLSTNSLLTLLFMAMNMYPHVFTLLKELSNVESLSLRDFREKMEVDPSAAADVSEFHNLVQLELYHRDEGSIFLKQIPENCPHIEALSITDLEKYARRCFVGTIPEPGTYELLGETSILRGSLNILRKEEHNLELSLLKIDFAFFQNVKTLTSGQTLSFLEDVIPTSNFQSTINVLLDLHCRGRTRDNL
ncbi:Leucine-rich repeat domain superfamily [Sesbania bispinosa]|nr:Leucine-rich repeat domain superfamily [Sesbania bispinosa]